MNSGTVCFVNDPRSVGRPPGPHDETLAKLLPAAFELFLVEGGAALTPTRLHKETGISRATIYRNWPEPADLIEIMLQRATRLPEAVEATGDLRIDLYGAMSALLVRLEHRPVRAFFAACLEYGRRSDRVATAASAYIASILAPFRIAIDAAAEAGGVDGDVDELAADVAGPAILRHVVLGEALSADQGRAIVDRFVAHRLPPLRAVAMRPCMTRASMTTADAGSRPTASWPNRPLEER